MRSKEDKKKEDQIFKRVWVTSLEDKQVQAIGIILTGEAKRTADTITWNKTKIKPSLYKKNGN
jgi:hypothetical protein